MLKQKKDNGFTLIEFAIVLVIIGLIVGAVLGGQEMINASRRNGVVSEISSYKSAYDQFKEKYYGIPGDLLDATSYFNNTSNGDGTSFIDNDAERLTAFEHLYQAGFIKGGFTGDADANNLAVINEDYPESSYSNVCYEPYKSSDYISNGDLNMIRAGYLVSAITCNNSFLTPGDAYAIDKKLDDSKPLEGQLKGYNGADSSYSACANANSAGESDDTYDTDSNTKGCIVMYYLDPIID
jgi:prepilin-type N-terminal cleavage/methylation domain-containing protein